MKKCSFCGEDIQPGTGEVTPDGKWTHNKCVDKDLEGLDDVILKAVIEVTLILVTVMLYIKMFLI